MKRAVTNCRIGVLLLLVSACGFFTPASAQAPDDIMGAIPGTGMLRDEFRARARAQLTAVALNAFVHRQIYNEYPETLYDLYNSEAWNLDPQNMFTGEPIDAVIFEPKTSDMTTKPYLELPFNFSVSSAPPLDLTPMPQGPEGGPPAPPPGGALSTVRTARVEPTAIEDHNAGDIFYFAKETMLQLIVWAPDGTYQEVVYEVPNPNWGEVLEVNSGAPDWPANLMMAQTAYYLERELPQAYNLIRFMGDSEPLPQHVLMNAAADERLLMASAIGVNVLNPLSKQPIEVSQQKSPGDLYEPDPENPLPLQLVNSAGEVFSLAQLRQAPRPTAGRQQNEEAASESKAKAKVKDKTHKPPMGGKRS